LSKPAGTAPHVGDCATFNWRNSQKMALNAAKTTGKPAPKRQTSGTDLDATLCTKTGAQVLPAFRVLTLES
jgi:hypothetical protein